MIKKIIIFIFGIFVMLTSFFLIFNMIQEKKLKDNINYYIKNKSVSEKSVISNYKEIENKALEYFKTKDVKKEELNKIFNDIYDLEFFTSESIASSLQDNFNNDLNKLNNLEKLVIENINNYIELNNYDKIKNNYKNENKYYKNLYLEVMGEEKTFDNLEKKYVDLKNIYEKYFEISKRYINFLKNSTVEIDESNKLLKFESKEEVKTYDSLEKELNESLSKIVKKNN